MKKELIVTTTLTLALLGLAAGCGGSDIGEAKAKESPSKTRACLNPIFPDFSPPKTGTMEEHYTKSSLHLTIRNMNTRSTQRRRDS